MIIEIENTTNYPHFVVRGFIKQECQAGLHKSPL